MRRLSRALAATALLIATTSATAANALEASPELPPADRPYHEVTDQPVYSPYGKTVHCLFTRDYISRGTCYQQRPDGQWVHMVNMDPALVYPVWEDPEALFASLPREAQLQLRKIYGIAGLVLNPGTGPDILFSPAIIELITMPAEDFA